MDDGHLERITDYLRANGGGFGEAYYVTMADMAREQNTPQGVEGGGDTPGNAGVGHVLPNQPALTDMGKCKQVVFGPEQDTGNMDTNREDTFGTVL